MENGTKNKRRQKSTLYGKIFLFKSCSNNVKVRIVSEETNKLKFGVHIFIFIKQKIVRKRHHFKTR